MKFCKRIPKRKAVPQAKELIRGAKKVIIATMHVDEEFRHSLPDSYHAFLAKKASEGVLTIRYGFGSFRVFEKLKERYPKIRFIYAGNAVHYQRMLIIDHRRGMFGLGGMIFYTEFAPLIQSLIQYTQYVQKKLFGNRKEVKIYEK